jgi:hypothetical protein
MSITIETKALGVMLYGTLSCQCPVTAETEAAWVAEWRKAASEESVSLGPFMDIADTNPQRTPLHVFVDFCSFSKEDPDQFIITEDDALRYFSSAFHFDRILAGLDPVTIFDPPAHMVGHMLLPVQIDDTGGPNGAVCTFTLDRHSVHFRHLVVPPDVVDSGPEAWYGFHFGTILTGIDLRQKRMIEAHLRRIDGFRRFLDRVDEVDYQDYQSFGNYHDRVVRRYERNGFL